MNDRIAFHSLEYPIVDHCNLRCANCDHASPFLPAKFVEMEQFASDLEALAQVAVAEEFRILGGEPLLHPKLVDLMKIARSAAIGKSLTLVTNGSLLHRAPVAMWGMIDRLWVSVYPSVHRRMSFEEIRLRCEEAGVIADIRPIESFHQTIMPRRNPDRSLVAQIYRDCKLAHEWKCYTVYHGMFYKCAPAPYLRKRVSLDLDESALSVSDGVMLKRSTDLRRDLLAYLSSSRPLIACEYCLGSNGPEVSHSQLARNRQGRLVPQADLDRSFNDLINISGV